MFLKTINPSPRLSGGGGFVELDQRINEIVNEFSTKVNTAQSTANSAVSAASTAQNTANAALPKSMVDFNSIITEPGRALDARHANQNIENTLAWNMNRIYKGMLNRTLFTQYISDMCTDEYLIWEFSWDAYSNNDRAYGPTADSDNWYNILTFGWCVKGNSYMGTRLTQLAIQSYNTSNSAMVFVRSQHDYNVTSWRKLAY